MNQPRLTDDQRATVEANIDLVHRYVKSRHVPAHDREDAVQNGCLGLCRAAQTFDPARGIPFEAWAWMRIAKAFQYERLREQGVNYRRAYDAGCAGDFEAPASLDEKRSNNDADLNRFDAVAVADYDLETVADRIDAETIVAALNLTDDEIAVLTWTCEEAGRWLGLSPQGVSHRRCQLRKRLVRRLVTVAA